MMTYLIERPELVPAVLLVAVLLTIGAGFAARIARMGDDFGSQLDAMAVRPVSDVPAADRYARFDRRDYSGDRGGAPTPAPPDVWRFSPAIFVPAWRDFYAETAARLHLDPLGGTA